MPRHTHGHAPMHGQTRSPPPDPNRKPEPVLGPDEEGEVPLSPDAIPKGDDAAWVSENHKHRKK